VMGGVTLVGYYLLNRNPSPGLLRGTLLRVTEALPSRARPGAQYQRLLTQAGYNQPGATQSFHGIKIAAGAGLGLILAVARMLAEPDLTVAFIALVAGAGAGYLLPDRLLEYAVNRRARKLLFGVPTSIDLLVLSLEAGQSLDSALMETAREIRAGYPELASELGMVQKEILGSRSRPEVFRNLRDRNREPEVKRLAQVFIDSDRFGTPLAPALRSHVKFLRVRLRQQAQEKARKISVKLIFPVFFLIFPAVILVTLGPAVIQIHTQLGSLVGK
jgi:tight adherence protein C